MDPTLIPLDIFTTLNTLNTKALATIRAVSVTVAIVIFLGVVWRTKGAVAQTVICACLVAMALAFIFKITDVQKIAEDTIPTSAAPAVTTPAVTTPPGMTPMGTVLVNPGRVGL